MVAPQGNLNLASFGNIVVPWGATKTPFYLGIFFHPFHLRMKK
jgi:hypothetical protein